MPIDPIPQEIQALRERLAQLEAMAETATSFNAAVRRRAGVVVETVPTEEPVETPVEPAPAEPAPTAMVTRGVQGGTLKTPTASEAFNTGLRKARGFDTDPYR